MSTEVASTLQEVFMKHPDIKTEDVQLLKEWLAKQKHLPPVSDHQVAIFLFSCNYSLEATKSCIDAYYTVKTASPEFFMKRDPLCRELQQIAQVVRISSLSATSAEGYRYIIGGLNDVDPNHFHLDAAIKLLFMVIDATMRRDAMTPGVVFIYDMKGVVFQHMTRISPVTIKKYIIYLKEAMPIRLKALHVINVNSVIHSIMALIKPFLNVEQLKTIKFHSGDLESTDFFKTVPQKIMPADYGGEDFSTDKLMQVTQTQLLSYRGWFEEEEKLQVDETKRINNKTRNAGTIFGMDGSFKKLSID